MLVFEFWVLSISPCKLEIGIRSNTIRLDLVQISATNHPQTLLGQI